MKTIGEYFNDFEAHYFGYGYGSGEEHTVWALKNFLDLVPMDGGYDYMHLEKNLTPVVAWLMINILCKANILEYGTSPRYAWLTPEGKALKVFCRDQNVDELLAHLGKTEDYSPCYPDGCNCDGWVAGKDCGNPFFHVFNRKK